MYKTYNFREEDYEYSEKLTGEYQDLRNGIICKNPSLDFECYFNYLEFLNKKRDNWRSFGYFDIGMMPVVMAPSFMQEVYLDIYASILSKLNLKTYRMKPVTLIYEARKLPFEDVWVFRKEAAELMGKDSGRVSAIEFLRWCTYK